MNSSCAPSPKVFPARFHLALGLAVLCMFALCTVLWAQTTISGDLVGTVTDPSGAAVPNATLTLTSTTTGQTRTATSGAAGDYRFALLTPGGYSLTATANGFQSTTSNVSVSVGQTAVRNIQLQVGSQSQTVTVTAAAPLLHPENANLSTTFSLEQVHSMPNPGNDITFMGQLAPGSVVNSTNQAANGLFGYGNFSSFGLPATSNNFTVNGADENDPFFNLNNSGATNLLLGNNEIAEVTVTSNAYTAQYGGLGGAQLNEITRSGTNQFHGNLVYWWNGRMLNANSYFNNQQGVKRPFVNDNQWAASIGGPIRHDKAFFFLDTEGIRFIFPTSNQVFIPSASYQASVLSSVAANNPTEVPYYTKLFDIYNTAPGAAGAITYNGNPDVNTFRSTASSGAREWILTGRLDFNIGQNDKLFGRYKQDKGFQPSYTDPLNPAFDLVSNQPSYEGQVAETHSFTPNIINQFLVSGAYYRAIFEPPSISANESLFEGGFIFSDINGDQFNDINPYGYFFNGRNATQYGVEDDLSITHGVQTFRVGWMFKRDDITDYDPLEFLYPVNVAFGPSLAAASGAPGLTFNNGYAFETEQDFPLRQSDPVALYQMGMYGEDDWNATPDVKLTLGLRVEHNSNPICVIDCFSRLNGDFYGLSAKAASAADPMGIPYNSLIAANEHNALNNLQKVAIEPRFGFTWSPRGGNSNTVLRGGFGMFADVFPGTIADSLLFNPPNDLGFTIIGGLLDPALPGSGSAIAASNAAAFRGAFTSGGSATSITAASPTFTPPNFTSATQNEIHYPTYEEWSLQVQHQFGRSTAITLGYVGNHGFHEPVQQVSANAFGFGSLPATAPLPSFAQVNLVESEGSSNYNGGTLTVRHRDKYTDATFNYTYSHALDEVSNGGFLPFNPTNAYYPIDPYNLSFNYGNADYDVRHSITGNYVITLPWWHRTSSWLGNWQLSGTVFFHTGFPFSVTDGSTSSALAANNYFSTLLADQVATPNNHTCSTSAIYNFVSGAGTPCLDTADFGTATGFGLGRRNAFFGPHYFDTDLGIQKGFLVPHHEHVKLNVGAQFFNILNHPNFANPDGDISSPLFGLIDGTVSTPTSIFGNGLGGDASPRIIQLKGSFTF